MVFCALHGSLGESSTVPLLTAWKRSQAQSCSDSSGQSFLVHFSRLTCRPKNPRFLSEDLKKPTM